MPEIEDALIVFAKIPEPNKVKTRLTTVLTPEQAARLYKAFLRDAIDMYVTLPVDVRLYFSPSKEPIPPFYSQADISVHLQKGERLGNRMVNAFAETFVEGYKRIVIIGTDHPTLPVPFIEQAFLLLKEPYSISIGPSEDGGFYLLGMNEFYPQLFRNMTYSHEEVFNDTIERAGALSASLNILPTWYDVDTPETLFKMIEEMGEVSMPLKRTRSVVSNLQEHYPSLRV